MRQLLKILLKGALGLTAVTVMVTTAQAAPINDRDQVQNWPAVTASPPQAFLLAQNAEPVKAKPAPPAPSPKKARAPRDMDAPSPQMERHDSKSVISDEPERAGTKKLGGQIIRSQEAPGGE